MDNNPSNRIPLPANGGAGETPRVLTLSSSVRGGGAEAIARAIAESLERRGHASHLRARATAEIPARPLFSATPFDYRKSALAHRLRYLPATFAEWLGVEGLVSKEAPHLLKGLPFEPSIIHCHNIRDRLLRLEDLPRLCRSAPVVWTLHDMWPFTGHCAYALDCDRWLRHCGHCPDLNRYYPIRFDFSRLNRWRRARVYRKIARETPGRLTVVCPSEWLASLARRSIMKVLPVRVIPNGIDTGIFRPAEPSARGALRREWGVEENQVVIMFAANLGARNPFKDYETFVEAARIARGQNPRLFFAAAGMNRGMSTEKNGLPVLGIGRAVSPGEMAALYGAADIFVHATRADNHPLAPMEAMACGLPVIATRVGGVPEIVSDGETGVLFDPGDAEGAARAMVRLGAAREEARAFGEAGLRRARNFFHQDLMVDRYWELYRELTGSPPAPGSGNRSAPHPSRNPANPASPAPGES